MAGLTTLDAVPSVISQGSTVYFLFSSSDFPAPTWAVSFAFRQRAGAGAFSVNATAAGSSHLCTITAAESAAFPPGVYTGEARATSGAEVAVVWSGSLEVKVDLSQAPDGYDTRTPARKILDSLLELAASRASQDIASYTVAGQSFTHAADADLRQRIAYWQAIVDAEEGKTGRVAIRFQ